MDKARVARTIRELYATQSASAVLLCVEGLFPAEVGISKEKMQGEEYAGLASPWHPPRPPLPDIVSVRNGAPKLLEAVALRKGSEAAGALGEMGIIALCPSPEQQVAWLEFSVRSVVGPARVVPLVDLAVFAVELGLYDKAIVYLTEAYSLSLGPPELHHLHTVAGTVALSRNSLREARIHLAESCRVCRESEVSCQARGLNLELADQLLHHGEKKLVIEYLTGCREIWRNDANRITRWIEEIQRGQEPDFGELRLREQVDVVMLQRLSVAFIYGE